MFLPKICLETHFSTEIWTEIWTNGPIELNSIWPELNRFESNPFELNWIELKWHRLRCPSSVVCRPSSVAWLDFLKKTYMIPHRTSDLPNSIAFPLENRTLNPQIDKKRPVLKMLSGPRFARSGRPPLWEGRSTYGPDYPPLCCRPSFRRFPEHRITLRVGMCPSCSTSHWKHWNSWKMNRRT